MNENQINTEEEIKRLKRELEDRESEYTMLQSLYYDLEYKYKEMAGSHSWRLTAPLRSVLDRLKGIRKRHAAPATYEEGKNRMTFSKEELEEQRLDTFRRDITISVIVPLYNTPEKFLREMIESVIAQTYAKWELCLADGSDDEHGFVGSICAGYTKKDKRIKYKKLEKNLGISGNTNESLSMSTGEYIALFDHDDLLHPAALHEVMKAICEGGADFVYTDECIFKDVPEKAYLAHLKPDFAPDNLIANNYICHLSVFSREIYEQIGGFRSEFDGSQDHDFILRATRQAHCIAHIPEVLYFWRCHPGSVTSGTEVKSYASQAGVNAVRSYLESLGKKCTVERTEQCDTVYRVTYELEERPLVSIIIPNYEHKEDLKRCIDSIYDKSEYKNFELVIVENNSKCREIFDYYEQIKKEHDNIKVVTWSGKFNFSAICNYGVTQSSGELFLFLNNDTEVIAPKWLEEMISYALREDVGAVGAKLYYSDDKIQHAGVLFGFGGLAGHYGCGLERTNGGYMGRYIYAQNQTAVTGACLMMRREVFAEINGFDEDFAVAFNDVDLCLRIRKAGYLIVWTPYAELYHYESKSRGYEDTPEKKARFKGEAERLQKYWRKEFVYGDPYFNPNFVRDNSCFEYKNENRPYAIRYVRK